MVDLDVCDVELAHLASVADCVSDVTRILVDALASAVVVALWGAPTPPPDARAMACKYARKIGRFAIAPRVRSPLSRRVVDGVERRRVDDLVT